MAFTAADVKTLREKTGCGMMDCKKALTESGGDMDKAVDFLREKGLAAAAKKSGRIAAEGTVYAYSNEFNTVSALVEVNAETDFVAKNDEFIKFVHLCAKTVADKNPADVDELMTMTPDGESMELAALLRDKILTIGENIKVRRFARYEGVVASYIHGGGRIGVMVRFETDANNTADLEEYGKDIAMQVAASSPQYLDRDSVPVDVIEHEKTILKEQVINEGKPANIAEKIVMGKLVKFYKEFCLLEQPYIKNSDMDVQSFTKEMETKLGKSIKITGYIRFERGEGMEKREDNFADEVKNMIQ